MKKLESTIYKRGEYYKAGSYTDVYYLYSMRSNLRRYFTKCSMYVKHVSHAHSKQFEFVSTMIVSSRVRGSLGEVNSIEVFNECRGTDCNEAATEVKYHTKSILVLEDNAWKILREERNKVVEQ